MTWPRPDQEALRADHLHRSIGGGALADLYRAFPGGLKEIAALGGGAEIKKKWTPPESWMAYSLYGLACENYSPEDAGREGVPADA